MKTKYDFCGTIPMLLIGTLFEHKQKDDIPVHLSSDCGKTAFSQKLNKYNYLHLLCSNWSHKKDMGAASSINIDEQNKFVNKYTEQFKKNLPPNYTQKQIQGKLRQLYHKADLCEKNHDSYILDTDWKNAKLIVIVDWSMDM